MSQEKKLTQHENATTDEDAAILDAKRQRSISFDPDVSYDTLMVKVF